MPQTSNRIKRSAENLNDTDDRETSQSHQPVLSTEHLSYGCKISPMTVNFTELGWSDWIISPETYNAGHCQGICDFPMTKEAQNPTNHALVLSLMSMKDTETIEVKPPCCSPSKYKPLNVLYYNIDDIVVFKSYPEMQATECGCR